MGEKEVINVPVDVVLNSVHEFVCDAPVVIINYIAVVDKIS